ncbi:lysylphosphatidylglycerol synthase domain-containing protein [Aestuariibacter sp. GS-14]|uniref:lysylphosphatidylglycerol synthase domain-containing protein n=1 Tax=Aestuariibacter sp. GS-14 TaxID=2590670 RepID=UPI0015E8338B|nr:lysylphosphatidylglycerol synthase domain-containing protein [Aestuariibacter sp. GS-14]
MKKVFSLGISVILLICTLVAVEFAIGWHQVIKQFGVMTLQDFLYLMCLMLFTASVRTARVMVSLRIYRNIPALFHVCNTHNLFNNLLPMRTGELAFPILMHRHFRESIARSAVHLLQYRLLDLLALMCTAAIILANNYSYTLVALIILIALTLLITAPLIRQFAIYMLSILERRFNNISKITHAFRQLPLQGRVFWCGVLLTFLQWAGKLAAFMYLVEILSPLPPDIIILAIVGADLSSVLPIHGIAGSGTFEAGFLLASYHSEVETATLLEAGVQLHIFLLVSAIAMTCLSKAIMFIHALVARRQKHHNALNL